MSTGDDGRALLNCHAGCEFDAIVGALELKPADLFPDDAMGGSPRNGQTARRIVKAYDYTDEQGELLFQVVRFEPKGFAQRRPDGSGDWVWKLGKVRRVLYRLPQLVAAPLESVVYFVEGEKDTDRLAKQGMVATTCPGGAAKWRDEYAEHLEGRHIVIIPDADTPGRGHAQLVAGKLQGRAAYVRVVDLWPDRDDGSDVSDWLDAGHDTEDLARPLALTPAAAMAEATYCDVRGNATRPDAQWRAVRRGIRRRSRCGSRTDRAD